MPVLLAPLARLGTVLCLFLGLACHHAFQGTSTSWYHNLESPAVSCSLAGLVADYRTARPSAGNSSISVLDADSTGICTGYSDRVDGDSVGQYVRDSRHHATGVLEPPLCHHSTSSSGNRGHGDMASSREDFFKTMAGVGIGAVGALSVLPDPANALLEDIRKEGKCPKYEAVEGFNVDKYMGIWYELAYHDWTQIDFCGCTRFNMTRTGYQIKDAFTTKCPYQHDEGETFMINMREEINMATPGSFREHAFYNTWRNKVVALWRSPDGMGGERYERAIQLQCVEILGRRAFVGINFLSRTPIVQPQVLKDMFDRARLLGLAPIGGNPAEMVMVPHRGCQYPSSTDSSLKRESLSWGSGWGVNKLTL